MSLSDVFEMLEFFLICSKLTNLSKNVRSQNQRRTPERKGIVSWAIQRTRRSIDATSVWTGRNSKRRKHLPLERKLRRPAKYLRAIGSQRRWKRAVHKDRQWWTIYLLSRFCRKLWGIYMAVNVWQKFPGSFRLVNITKEELLFSKWSP